MVTTLGIAWGAWKVAAKRLGPVGGLVAAVLAAAGYRAFRRKLREGQTADRSASSEERGQPFSL